VQKERRCAQPGWNNLTRPKSVDKIGIELPFCAGKATWSEHAAILFSQCRVSFETGILPKPGSIDDQDEIFAAVFPYFVERWTDRRYNRIWVDVQGFVFPLLEKLFGK
jgi:hypothetical protein